MLEYSSTAKQWGPMIVVVELYRTGVNVFKTGANFLTYDTPDPERLGHRIFWTLGETLDAHRKGAAIFGEFGPQGYRAFLRFEKFLMDQNIIPKADGGPRPMKRRKSTPRSKLGWR